MQPRPTLIGTIARAPVMRNVWLGRAILAIILAVLLVLTFFPERYRAAVTLTPTDPASLGLSGTLGQLGALNSVFGNQAAVEVALKIGRSVAVQQTVTRRLNLVERMHEKDPLAVYRWLQDHVTTRSLRGGIIQFETLNKDPELAKDIVGAYAGATQAELALISRRQTEYKRDLLVKLVGDASDRLSRARGAYDSFRLQNRYADPTTSIGEIGSQIPQLETSIRAKEVQLRTARQFATDDNLQVQQILAQLSAMRAQLARAQATSTSPDNSVGRAVAASTQAERLQRELKIAQTLYDNYMRFLEGTSVEDLTSTASVRVLEPAFVDTDRQVNWSALTAAVAIFLLWAAIEFYRLRPPVGERIVVREA